MGITVRGNLGRRISCHRARRAGTTAAYLLVILVLFLPLLHAPRASAASETVSVWLTTGDRGKLLEPQSTFNFGGDTTADLVINVNEHHRYQSMDGFGAAMTDSSSWLMANKLSASQRADLLNRLFSPATGIGMSYLRVPVGASDFSLRHYTHDDTCCDLSDFSIASDEVDRIPILLEAKAVNPGLKLMGSPWTAPAWMKTTESLYRGTLKAEFVDDYAAYLARFADAWAARGLPIASLTLGNEPQHTPADYPGMWLTPSDEANLVKQLGPALAGKGVELLALDHNWALAHYGVDVLNDPSARQYVDGTAFHCYGGLPDYQRIVREAHPDKAIHFTECSSGNWATNWADNLVWDGVNLLVGATRNWSRSVLKWNLALDTSHGPHTGGCGGCTGVVTIDPGTGAVTYNHDYYAIGHASKFVVPGAQRIASTARAGSDLHSVAFRNPDGSKVLIVVNAGGQGHGFLVRWGGQSFSYSLQEKSIATFKWSGSQGAPAAPAAPTGLSATAGDAKVTLGWDFSPLATSYDVKRSAGGGPFTTIATGVALPEYVDRDVVGGTSYTYVVSAVNGTGQSPDSAVATASPGPPLPRSAAAQLEAESFDAQSGIGIAPCSDATGCGQSVGYAENGDYLAWNQVHFGDAAESVAVRVASGSVGGTLELRLGSPSGTLVGSVPIENTGGWGAWTTRTAPVSGASGVQSLYVVFKGPPPETASDGIADLNWIQFTVRGAPPDPGGPLSRAGWTATASPSGGDTRNALDGDAASRWTSGQGQASGHWFRVDLGSAQTFDRLVLDSGTGGDYPRGLEVHVSDDGATWTKVATAVGSGQMVEVPFAAQTSRHLKLVQTGSAGNWWSIHELNLLAPSTPPPPPPVVDTGFRDPAASSADTGGDGNGFQTNPAGANANDTALAVDTDSGSGTSTNCTNSGKDRHRFRDYGFALPTGASIKGIEVRLDARADSTAGSPRMCVQLSWNGGASWTSAKTTSTLTTSEATYVLGGATTTWGRTWSTTTLGDASFRVRVVNVANSRLRDFSLDWIAVKVHYTS